MESPANKVFTEYQHQVIKELKAQIASLTNQVNTKNNSPIKGTSKKYIQNYWNLPYVFEITSKNENKVQADNPVFLYIRDDEHKGLRVPGRNGYIKNDGPGNLSYRLNNGSENVWSHPATLKRGEIDTFDYNDNIQIVIVEITADTNKTRFRTRFTPGFVGD